MFHRYFFGCRVKIQFGGLFLKLFYFTCQPMYFFGGGFFLCSCFGVMGLFLNLGSLTFYFYPTVHPAFYNSFEYFLGIVSSHSFPFFSFFFIYFILLPAELTFSLMV